jgi:hypothetical protein
MNHLKSEINIIFNDRVFFLSFINKSNFKPYTQNK